MELVQTLPRIYDKRRKDYKDTSETKCWDIDDQLQIYSYLARSRYDVIRTRFSRYLELERAVRPGSGLSDLKIQDESLLYGNVNEAVTTAS